MDRKLKLKIWNQEKEKEPYLITCDYCYKHSKYFIVIAYDSNYCYWCFMKHAKYNDNEIKRYKKELGSE